MPTRELAPDELDLSLVRGGPLYGLLIRMGIARAGVSGVTARMVIYAAVTWLPLAVLSWIQGQQAGAPLLQSFLANFAQSVRFLAVVPLLIFAELQIQPWLSHVVRYFVRSGLITEAELPCYLEFIRHSQRLRDSLPVELGLLAFAFLTSAFGLNLAPHVDDGQWLLMDGKLTLAGEFFRYFAMPVVRFLWLRWCWRIVIWWSLLARISRLKLKLVPTHPDCVGGLGFLAAGHNHFAILVFAFSCQGSAAMGQFILYHGYRLDDFKGTILSIVVFMVLFNILPLLVFTPKLIDCKRKGLYEYGILAKQYVDSFHSKWVPDQEEPAGATADKPVESDSKVQDKFKVVGNMRAFAFDRGTIFGFATAAILPFAPLLLTMYRFDQLLDQLVHKLI